jgi:hypothetical protein
MSERGNTSKSEHRAIRFESIDDLLAEIDRIVAADRAGTLRQTGNWTPGTILGHVAAWINYAWEGYPPGSHPPWFIRAVARLMRNRLLTKPMMRGMRIPKTPGNIGTFGVEP